MSLELLKNKEFNSIIKKLYKKYEKEIIDILLFGSAIRGKIKPKDIDLLILFKDKENLDIAYDFKKGLEKYNADITTRTWKNIASKDFQAKESFLSEAFSLINQEFVSKSFGFKSKILFKYELKNLPATKKILFHYALNGRNNNQGLIKQLKLEKFSDTAILSPIENSEELKEFFQYWNIKTKISPILLPERILAS